MPPDRCRRWDLECRVVIDCRYGISFRTPISLGRILVHHPVQLRFCARHHSPATVTVVEVSWLLLIRWYPPHPPLSFPALSVLTNEHRTRLRRASFIVIVIVVVVVVMGIVVVVVVVDRGSSFFLMCGRSRRQPILRTLIQHELVCRSPCCC